ncbi:MAG: IS21-like element helper ATPase IstB [Sphaerochaeta associata]|uniref:IS21-like element helper ATPase IstB n=1 Tax=Sphaerochaeta associata TaxID=1129264 RepID=UPI002B1F1B22|nr:IS21-like element helper ATPase IstB [Sphaerochaeta associata]MEA5029511.1 IS21-like element helper ATPase IstB [Sphaerochaeta associata]
MMDKRSIGQTKASLASVGFKHTVPILPELINIAEEQKLSYRSFLDLLIDKELSARNEKHRKRNLTGAHFPPNPRPLDDFDTRELESGITATQLYQLKDLNWIDAHVNILFLGPPGVGKTMLAIGLGLEAINAGYSVCFERMASLMEIMDMAKQTRAASFRLKRIRKADIVIIDEVGFTPIRREQANGFFNLVSEMYERNSIIFTTNKEIGQWSEVMGDPVLTTALLDRILHHSKCFSLRGESFRIKHPQEELLKY